VTKGSAGGGRRCSRPAANCKLWDVQARPPPPRASSRGSLSGLASLVAELVGTGTDRAARRRAPRPATPSYAGTDYYYPALLAIVKVGIALPAGPARLARRPRRAPPSSTPAGACSTARGRRPIRAAPRLRLELSPRLWLASFAVTSLHLPRAGGRRGGRSPAAWPLLAPWLHSSALPIFAVLAVAVAIAWRAIGGWLADYEEYAAATYAPGAAPRSRASAAHGPPPAGPVAASTFALRPRVREPSSPRGRVARAPQTGAGERVLRPAEGK